METWHKARQRGDFEAMAACFSNAARPLMLEKLKSLSEEERQRLVRDARKRRLHIGKARIDGDKAMLTVTKGSESETLSLTLESDGWKLLPNP